MNKKAIVFLLCMTFLPIICLFLYFWTSFMIDKRTGKDIYLDDRKPLSYQFRIDNIYRNSKDHNTLTLDGENFQFPVPRQWEQGIFEKGDSIVKQKDSLKVYLYRNKKLDTILDYNNIYIRE